MSSHQPVLFQARHHHFSHPRCLSYWANTLITIGRVIRQIKNSEDVFLSWMAAGSTNHEANLASNLLSESSSTNIDLLHSSRIRILCSTRLQFSQWQWWEKATCLQQCQGEEKAQCPIQWWVEGRIGKFALAAIKHFYAELGHEVPESTIRGMKDKYELVAERRGGGGAVSSDVTGPVLSWTPWCIRLRRLADFGEKVTSFLVIAAAKQVIMFKEPGMLN